jgi:farnesyl-diphosphate farnesyltransferase
MTPKWKASSVVDQDVTAAIAERESRAFLPRVSRTFALGVRLLPARLEAPVRIGYLLCRIADTVEDDLFVTAERKAALLDQFVACFDDPSVADLYGACSAELTADEPYLELVASTGHVFLTWRMLDPDSRRILRRWVEEMVGGMRRFVLQNREGLRIASVPEFREYCYYVAGTVGHLLTELWHAHSPLVGPRTYERLLLDCEAFGEALQTVNAGCALARRLPGSESACAAAADGTGAGRHRTLAALYRGDPGCGDAHSPVLRSPDLVCHRDDA